MSVHLSARRLPVVLLIAATTLLAPIGQALPASSVGKAEPLQEQASGQAQAEGLEHLPLVLSMLANRCATCHTPESENARGRRSFDGAADLTRVRDELVSPGDPDFSDLYYVLEDGSMPPEDSEVEPATQAEMDAVRAWIAAGAPLPPEEKPAADSVATEEGDDAEAEAAATEENSGHDSEPPSALGKFIRRTHPLWVHFPIALWLTALIAEVLQGRSSKPGLAAASRLCVVLAALGGFAAAYTGWGLSEDVTASDTLERHRWLGAACAMVGLVVLVCSERYALGKRPGWRTALRISLLLTATLVGIAAHLGGSLVYGEDWLTL